MRRTARVFALALSALMLFGSTAQAAEPLIPVDLPVLGHELTRGSGTAVPAPPIAPPATRTVDGQIADWPGRPTRYAGSAVYSGGSYVYQDHLYDAHGADDGGDIELNGRLDPLAEVLPESYRSEVVFRYLAGELDAPEPLAAETNYGDLGLLGTADLEEVHVSADAEYVHVMARTTSMNTALDTALLILVDNGGSEIDRAVPFNSGLRTRRADAAALVAGGLGWVADLGTSKIKPLPAGSVFTDPSGFNNVIEARIPRLAFGLHPPAGTLRIAIASGPYDPHAAALKSTGLSSNLANVAFRPAEPVREWFDKQQAFALYAGTIDPFFASIDLARLNRAATNRFVPGPGYHERIFLSTPNISKEGSRDTIWQHYGVYLPSAYKEGQPRPLQFWLHWRGGTAHSAATAAPDIFRQLGEAHDTIVVSPRGRGTSSWYVGAGQLDILQVFDEVTSTFAVDLNRVYLAGHSMGGWGSYLFSVLYPDRFAAALPASPPQTQGLYTGLDLAGCEDYTFDEYNLCYSPTDDARERDQALAKMLPNLLHTPVAVYTGAADELVWYPGVARNIVRLTTELGYRHRLYTFPTQEHYGPPIWDQWRHGSNYLHTFKRNPNPAHVVYRRDMPFERAVEEIRTLDATLQFDFDRSFWMSGLTPADLKAGAATFDGRSLAIPETPHLTVPEANGPAGLGQTGPYVMTGLRWMDDPTAETPAARNGLQATLAGARSVTLDLVRMQIDPSKLVEAAITSDRTLDLRLSGPWAGPVIAKTAAGTRLSATLSGGVLTVKLPAGTTSFTIRTV